MKVAVILNGISLAKEVFYKKYYPLLSRDHDVNVFETVSRHDGISLSQKAVRKKFDVIIVVGGDGTIHQAVNGMLFDFEPPTVLPLLAIIPLGSGNDFARALGANSSPGVFAQRLKDLMIKEIDVGEVVFSTSARQTDATKSTGMRYFLNVVDVGMGPSVVRGVIDSTRVFGSAVSYYVSIIKTFFTYQPVILEAVSSNWTWKGVMKTFAVANGKYYGNGLCVAPEAKLDDHVLDVFACGGVSILDFILQTIPLKKGKKVNHPQVSYYKTTKVELTSDCPLEIEADGEIIGWLPATVTTSKIKLRIVV